MHAPILISIEQLNKFYKMTYKVDQLSQSLKEGFFLKEVVNEILMLLEFELPRLWCFLCDAVLRDKRFWVCMLFCFMRVEEHKFIEILNKVKD